MARFIAFDFYSCKRISYIVLEHLSGINLGACPPFSNIISTGKNIRHVSLNLQPKFREGEVASKSETSEEVSERRTDRMLP